MFGCLYLVALRAEPGADELLPLGQFAPWLLLAAMHWLRYRSERREWRTVHMAFAMSCGCVVVSQSTSWPAMWMCLWAGATLCGLIHRDAVARSLRRLSALSLAVAPWGAGAWILWRHFDGAPDWQEQFGMLPLWGWTCVAVGAVLSVNGIGWVVHRERWWLAALESNALLLLTALLGCGHAPLVSLLGRRPTLLLELGLATLGLGIVGSIMKSERRAQLGAWLRSHWAWSGTDVSGEGTTS